MYTDLPRGVSGEHAYPGLAGARKPAVPHDELRITIACPKCGHELEETLARLERDPVVTCRCGARIDARGIDSTQAGTDDGGGPKRKPT